MKYMRKKHLECLELIRHTIDTSLHGLKKSIIHEAIQQKNSPTLEINIFQKERII